MSSKNKDKEIDIMVMLKEFYHNNNTTEVDIMTILKEFGMYYPHG